MKLKHIHSEIEIRTTPERMWEVLSQYGDVSNFHAGVRASHSVEGSGSSAAMGCERACNFVETGEKRVPIKKLKQQYRQTGRMAAQYG